MRKGGGSRNARQVWVRLATELMRSSGGLKQPSVSQPHGNESALEDAVKPPKELALTGLVVLEALYRVIKEGS